MEQELSVSTISNEEIDSDASSKTLEATLTSTIRLIEENKETYTSYSNGLSLYQEFILSYLKFNSKNESEATPIVGGSQSTDISATFSVGSTNLGSLSYSLDDGDELYSCVLECPSMTAVKNELEKYGSVSIVANVAISYGSNSSILKQFERRTSGDTSSGIMLQAKSNISYNYSMLSSSPISTSNVQDKLSRKYYLKEVSKAKVEYDVGDTNSGTSGIYSQLGVNANDENDANPAPIEAVGKYDPTALDLSNAKTVKLSLKLYRKNNNGGYDDIAIENMDDYLKDITLTSSDDNYSFEKDENSYTYTADFDSYNPVVNVDTSYSVYTGSENFEENKRIYANYKVVLEASLYDADGKLIDDSVGNDWIIYTNARIYTSVIK